jgi:biopolymer transport protein ExbD
MAEPTHSSESIADGSAPYAGWTDAASSAPPRRKKRKKRSEFGAPAPLTLNSLMDIVTILLVYLLKSYATSPIEVKDPAIALPTSTSLENVEEATVVMITGPEKTVPNPNNPAQTVIVPNIPTIVVDGTPIVQLDEATYRVPDAAKDAGSGGYVINALRAKLKEAAEMQAATAEVSDTLGFSGKVVIIADKRTPYRVLTDVLVTCGQAGFGEFRFAIVKEK